MGTTNKSLKTLLDHVDAGELVLPEIQRDFVWSKKNVLLLFDSLFRSLPIGYMLVWKAKTTVASKAIGKKIGLGHAIENFYDYLLDGQQRLTAVKLVRDGDDKYQLVFSLRSIDGEDQDVGRFAYRARWNDNSWYIPVADVLSEQVKPLQVVDELKKLGDFNYQEDGEKVLALLTRLKAIMDYEMGVIEFEDDDYRKATELFIRFNSTGKKLNRSDLAAAELALTVPNLVSQGISKVSMEYSPHFTFTKPFLIQCLAAVHTGKMKFSESREIWDGSDEKAIKNSWKKTGVGLGRTIELLTGTVKWDSNSWLPSVNSIIPLVYLLSYHKFGVEERRQARKWLLMANVHAIFSGSVHTELDRIVRGLKREPSLKKLWNLTKKDLSKIRPAHFETRRKSGAVMSLYVSMIRERNAKDWIQQTSLDGYVMGHNAQLQVHHFFPQNLLKNYGYKSEDINTFANYTIINKETNLDISAEEPAQYVKRLGIKEKHLKVQCIPPDRDLWRVDRYEDFLAERRRILASQTNTFLKM